jgi:hypothetical protein
VPAGDYEIVAWHEGWQILSEAKTLDVAAQAEVKRPICSPPSAWTKKVAVKLVAASDVSIKMGEK